MSAPSCQEFAPLLAELATSPLAADEAASDADLLAARRHVDSCQDCRLRLAEYRQVLALLDDVPCEVAEAKMMRRDQALKCLTTNMPKKARKAWWSRPAVWKSAAAAALLALVLFKLEFRLDGQQLVVRWGNVPAVEKDLTTPHESSPTQPLPLTPVSNIGPALEQRLGVVSESLHVLADVSDTRERELQAEFSALRRRIAQLEQQADRRFVDTERAMEALYTAQFGGQPRRDESHPNPAN